jgi:hypothetical protein
MSMEKVEAKLALWKRQYALLNDAQVRLNASLSDSASKGEIDALRAEVARLKEASDQAMKAVEAELALARARRGA